MAVLSVRALVNTFGTGNGYLQHFGVQDRLLMPIQEYLGLVRDYNKGLFSGLFTIQVSEVDNVLDSEVLELHKLSGRVEEVVNKLKIFAANVPRYIERLNRQIHVSEEGLRSVDLEITNFDKAVSVAKAKLRMIAGQGELSNRVISGDNSVILRLEILVEDLKAQQQENKKCSGTNRLKLNRAESLLRDEQAAYALHEATSSYSIRRLRMLNSEVQAYQKDMYFLIRERNRLGRWDSSKKAVLDEQIDNYTHVIASYDKQIHQEHVDQNTAARAANESIPAIEAATSRVKYASEKVQKDEEAFCELQARISDAQAIIYKAKSDIINCGYATTCLKEKAEVLLDEIKGLNSSKKRKRKEAHKAQRTIVELNQAIARLSKFARFTQLF